jgi:protease-4
LPLNPDDMTFFKSFLSSCLGAFVAFALIILFCVLMVSGLVTATLSDKEVVVADNSVLQLKLTAPVSEVEVDDPIAELFPGAGEPAVGLMQLKQAITYAKTDKKIKGIYLNISSPVAGITTLEEIRESLLDFRQSGKWVVAYSDSYSEGAYFLASASDKVFLNPEGDLEFNGLSLEATFFKKMLDKLEIKPEVFRVGEFKSAVEPFLRDNMSDANRLQLNSLITSMYSEMIVRIAESRKIPKDKLKEISDKMLVRDAHTALEYGLVDSLYYEDQVRADLRHRLGLAHDANIPVAKYSRYRKSISTDKTSSNEIAVIVADGSILPGESDRGVVGGETISEEIRKARKKSSVKAIVIRVNSPGGAFSASDEMWREVSLAAKEKVVIASMSDLAASGGYYLSMAADTIVAQPTTITGSIGIFSVLFDLSGFLGNKIGITSEEVKTGEVGSMTTVMRPLTAQEKAIWQKKTDDIYETFTSKAAKGRRMSQEAIKKIASGRVWTGAQAKENGLVDVLGGFEDALRIAARAAKLGDDYKVRYYPHQKTILEKLTGDLEQSTRVAAMRHELGEYYPWWMQWQRVKQYGGVQARMPLEFEVR